MLLFGCYLNLWLCDGRGRPRVEDAAELVGLVQASDLVELGGAGEGGSRQVTPLDIFFLLLVRLEDNTTTCKGLEAHDPSESE